MNMEEERDTTANNDDDDDLIAEGRGASARVLSEQNSKRAGQLTWRQTCWWRERCACACRGKRNRLTVLFQRDDPSSRSIQR